MGRPGSGGFYEGPAPGAARSGGIGGPLSPVLESPGSVFGGGGGAPALVSDSVPTAMFSSPGTTGFKVRGPTYLQDKKKVSGC